MPSVVVNGSKKNTTSILTRSESLRSEVSDASQNKKVSFNKDVRIRRIPQSTGIVHGQVVAVLEPSSTDSFSVPSGSTSNGCLWINSKVKKSETVEQDLLAEAKKILNNVDKIECTTSPKEQDSSKTKRLLERSKSEILPSGFRRSQSEPPLSNASVSKFFEGGFPAYRLLSNSKPVRIKKPRRRIGLDRIASDSGSSSGSERRLGTSQILYSESPLSSSSSDRQNMATATQPRYGSNPRVASMVTKLGSMRRESTGPPLRSSFLESANANTHNNNQPFSYTSSPNISDRRVNGHDKRTTMESQTNGHGGKSSREVIYAQVVSREKKDGTPEKRTIHKKYSDMTTSTTASDSPSDAQKHIRHFVYDKENWKNLNESHNATDSSNLVSSYRGRSQYGSKNNVTTVLLNSNDEEDSLRSTRITNNDLFKHSSRSSSSPPRLNRPFFYGDSRHGSTSIRHNIKTFDHSSSSSPQFQYSSSSREQSPAGVLKNTELRKPIVATIPPPPKMVSKSYATGNSRNHTDYQYMTNKLGYLTPSEYSTDTTRLTPRVEHRSRPASMDRVGPTFEQVKVNGWSRSNRAASADYKANNGYKDFQEYSTVDNYRKVSPESDQVRRQEPKPVTKTVPTGTTNTNNSRGLISSLMHRSKDKKGPKEKTAPVGPTTVGKVKPKNRFLSLFFDSKNGTSKSSDKLSTTPKNISSQSKIKHIVSDSEIDDAERKRDGEYHSWSSVDEAIRMEHHARDQGQKQKLNRGKSYNLGDYAKIPEDPWHNEGDIDSREYRRRDLTDSNYKSATMGRPATSAEYLNEDTMPSRTKSLDRRTSRSSRYDPPPKLIVTPSSPPVDESGNRWDQSYSNQGQKLNSKLSKSSVELDSYNRHYDSYRNDHHEGSPTRLRYFGDTDAESIAANSRIRLQNSRFDSRSPSSSFQNGKIDQGRRGQNGSDQQHVSRRDTLLQRKGRNDGLSSEESESRFSKSSSRSVFLHAPTVAEIPPPGGLQGRTLSKDEISNYSGSQKQTRHVARSMSVLAPWRPRPSHEKYEVRYDSEGYNDTKYRRPPRPPRSPNQRSMSPALPPPIKRRSESSEHLLQDPPKPKLTTKASTLSRIGSKLKRSKSTVDDSSSGPPLIRRKDNQRN